MGPDDRPLDHEGFKKAMGLIHEFLARAPQIIAEGEAHIAKLKQMNANLEAIRAELGLNPPLKYRSVEELKAQNPALYGKIQAWDEAKRARLAEHRQIVEEHKARIAATKARFGRQ
jgi:hypothetical protein